MNFRDKRVIIALIVILLLLLGGGGYFLASRNTQQPVAQTSDTDTVQALPASQIGLQLKVSSDKKKVILVISNAQDIKSFDYDITYDADIPPDEQVEGGGATQVTRDIHGENQTPSNGSYTSQPLDLGSCSRNVCRYDTGVKSLQAELKIIKNDGKTYSSQTSVNL